MPGLISGGERAHAFIDGPLATPFIPASYPRAAITSRRCPFCLNEPMRYGRLNLARAHGMWTYEPRQGRKAATVVCSASAVVTLAFQLTVLE
jgi:hypothetical protein